MHPNLVLPLIEGLIRLRQETDPRGGEGSAKDKDSKAFMALRFASELVETLAGWAIDHQVGLAMEGREFASVAPHDAPDLPEYVEARTAADDHRHELAGRPLREARRASDQMEPDVARQALLNLLLPNPGGFPNCLTQMVSEALRALDYNESLPILKPRAAGRKVSFRTEQLQLKAICIVAYQVARGSKKVVALQKVGDALAVDPGTLIKWEQRLRESDRLGVARALSHARAAAAGEEAAAKAQYTGEPTYFEGGIGDLIYGWSALLALSKEIKLAARS